MIPRFSKVANYLNALPCGRWWWWTFLLFYFIPSHAQYNTDRLVTIGRSALYYEDYVLSIQYFNQVIMAKPYLYEPWFLRGVAKFYLDDFSGAEQDCTEAINRNPFVVGIYELRGLTRIQQEKFSDAISDYNRALRMTPDNRSLWHNRVLCHIQDKDYEKALLELDTMQTRWSQYAPAWNMRADVHMQQKDTALAVEALEKSLELDPYDGKTWAMRSIISLSRSEWKNAEDQLDHAIHLLPKQGGYYINRALARYNQNNLRGAMADYDTALDLEPNNFLGHYNRGLLRADVGDDNRAILDFDFVLRLEPDNMLALFNRAVLLEQTGDLKGAVDDYTKVIEEYPNFHTGILYRARCYRRLGMTQKAELEEFKVYKEQLYQHLYGITPKQERRSQRKRSDLDPDKYNQLVVADEEEPEREYQSDYRGRVQNRKADMELLPMFALSLEPQHDEVGTSQHYDPQVEALNQQRVVRPFYVSYQHASLDSRHSADYFSYIDSLTAVLPENGERRVTENGERRTERYDYSQGGGSADSKTNHTSQFSPLNSQFLLLSRAVAYSCLQDNDAACEDLTSVLTENGELRTTENGELRTENGERRTERYDYSQGEESADSKTNHTSQFSVLSSQLNSSQLTQFTVLALWQRAVCKTRQNQFAVSEGKSIELAVAGVRSDLTHALQLAPKNAYLHYNMGCLNAQQQAFKQAVADFTAALDADPRLAEAHYNRGICLLQEGKTAEGISDLSKAGEQGIYQAYSIIKKYSNNVGK